MNELEQELGYTFRDRALLLQAMTHSSYANENRRAGAGCNERLEFLGDAVLGMAVAEHLFAAEPDMSEGQMTRLRAELVCEKSLAEVAERLGLGRFLRLGRGEEQGGGRLRASINADAVEALLAALYLDERTGAGLCIRRRILLSKKEEFKKRQLDHKTLLQERVQRDGAQRIEYELTGERGPDHAKEFFMQVRVNGEAIGSGSGRSKKEAEQAAAADALSKMD
jgi:ribonuclease-3